MELNTEGVITKMAKIRARRDTLKAEFSAADGKLKTLLEACEAFLLEKFQAEGLDKVGVRGVGTAYRTTETYPRCADWDMFNRWIMETGNFQFYQKRLTSSAVTDYMKHNDGNPPPAIDVYVEAVIRFRKDTEK